MSFVSRTSDWKLSKLQIIFAEDYTLYKHLLTTAASPKTGVRRKDLMDYPAPLPNHNRTARIGFTSRFARLATLLYRFTARLTTRLTTSPY